MKKLFIENKNNIWFWLFVAVAAILFVAMPLMSQKAGNSGDEDLFQIPQGRFVVDYYQSHGADTTCLQDVVNFNGVDRDWNLKYYGCSFDVVTEWINRTFGIDDIASTRHACNALLGWLIVFFGGLIAYRIGGWRAGVFAMLLLFFSPRLLGHSFNNPKDIPFAAGVVMSIYYIMMFFRQITPELVGEVAAKGKKAVNKVVYPEAAFAEKTIRVIDIVLAVVGAVVVFSTGEIFIAVLLLAVMAAALFIKDTPHFNPLTLLMLALSLALAISNRIGGLIVAGYMGLWGLLWLLQNGKAVGGRTVGKAILVAVATVAVGFFAGLLLWPYAMQNPVANSLESFKLMSQFDVQLRQLFEGVRYMSDDLPWYYTPKFMLMTIPIAVIAGWLLYPLFGAFSRKRLIESIMLYFCFLFPPIWIIYTGANVYGGWRHTLFAYPPMAIAAGLGFDALVAWVATKSRKRWVEAIAVALPLLLMLPPALHTVKNHPYEYVYFNELGGGIKKAFGNYELDYYYHSMREATEWVMANAEPKADGSKTYVGSWHLESTKYFLRNDTARFATRFVRWGQRYEYQWDYLVFPITGISGSYLRGSHFPPRDCVHTVDVDGVPIAVILKRQTMDDYYATQFMRSGNIDTAIALYGKVLEGNPDNETALTNLASIHLQRGENDLVVKYCQKLLDMEPDNPQTNQMLIYAYLGSGRQQEAAAIIDKIRVQGTDAYPFSITARLYAQQGNLDAALAEINNMLSMGLMDQESLNLYVQIRAAQGADKNFAAISYYRAYADGLEHKGKKKAAEKLRKQLGIV